MARERRGHTLQTTALINEAYLRLVRSNYVQWRDRAHFFAVSAGIMRRILIDFARSRLNQKHGGKGHRISLDQVWDLGSAPQPDVIALDDALDALAQVDERKAKVVELRFFGGLTVEETAEVLRISSDTVTRDWNFARVWLLRECQRQKRHGTRTV
jgi:RNA polymerase sigma factor (TIGR02999 family)